MSDQPPTTDLMTCTADEWAAHWRALAARAVTGRAERLTVAYGRPVDAMISAAFLDVARECHTDTVATLAAVLGSARTFSHDNAAAYVADLDPTSRAVLLAALTAHTDQ